VGRAGREVCGLKDSYPTLLLLLLLFKAQLYYVSLGLFALHTNPMVKTRMMDGYRLAILVSFLHASHASMPFFYLLFS